MTDNIIYILIDNNYINSLYIILIFIILDPTLWAMVSFINQPSRFGLIH